MFSIQIGILLLYQVTPQNKALYKAELDEYFRLRKRILIDQKGWDLRCVNGLEIDQFDHDQAHYLLVVSEEQNQICGGVRLIPSISPNLTLDIFPHLIDSENGFTPCDEVWESSRFVIDTRALKSEGSLIKEATICLFIGMMEFGIRHQLKSILTMTEVRLERILRMCQWPLQRLGQAQKVGNTVAVTGLLEVSKTTSKRLKDHSGIQKDAPEVCQTRAFNQSKALNLQGLSSNRIRQSINRSPRHQQEAVVGLHPSHPPH